MFRACVGYAKENSNGEIPDVINGEPTQDYYVAPSMAIERNLMALYMSSGPSHVLQRTCV